MADEHENNSRFKSKVFHALSDPIRLEIIAYLQNGEKCVCEIVPHFNLIQPIVSRHLKILRDVGVIRCRKDGAKRMYSIVDVRILSAVDAIAPELINVLQKEAVRQMSCGSEVE